MRSRVAACIAALAVVAGGVLYAVSAQGADVDLEERTGNSAALTDNVGPAGDTSTLGGMAIPWFECLSKKDDRYHTRGEDTYYTDLPDIHWPHLPGVEDLWLTETALYRYCPNGTQPDKVKIIKFKVCVVHPDKRGQQISPAFDGVAFYPRILEVDGEGYYELDPLDLKPAANGTGDEVCAFMTIPKLKRQWFRVDQKAGYTTAFNIELGYGIKDRPGYFQENGLDFHQIIPGNDNTIPNTAPYMDEPAEDPVYTYGFPTRITHTTPNPPPPPSCIEPYVWDGTQCSLQYGTDGCTINPATGSCYPRWCDASINGCPVPPPPPGSTPTPKPTATATPCTGFRCK